ncbi:MULTISPECIES: hypothetical protein [unclassified Wenzhouxiangella]|uniref:hypothetical protein n=1 Tax=unclassified Wenzhouxiangella TaxID=2613841 RepID=UPI000E32C5CC|nr:MULTISPECIES: hypothetical protein [unclassified Wenzhouxiangella]RFF28377.1 hypothetical protein DZK25_02225 [Wenzhouxiangella sp. 15181]RFP69893.1 hypothetical protein DZK26_01325 [Wenzhouxiangella sp. 15190]
MRVLLALCAGLLVSVILIEAISAGLLVLLPESILRVEAGDGFGQALVWPLLPVPALVWIAGGLFGGMMTAALAPRIGWGLCTGALLGLPAFVLVGLTTPGNPLALLASALPLAGSAAGVALVARLQDEEATVSTNHQAV